MVSLRNICQSLQSFCFRSGPLKRRIPEKYLIFNRVVPLPWSSSFLSAPCTPSLWSHSPRRRNVKSRKNSSWMISALIGLPLNESSEIGWVDFVASVCRSICKASRCQGAVRYGSSTQSRTKVRRYILHDELLVFILFLASKNISFL